jgi:hypothetical protein
MKEIKNTLVIPLVTIFEEDSLRVVYVKNRKGFEMRQISTGLSSSKEVIVTSGLNEKDEVALIKPSLSQIKDKILLTNDSLNID